MIGPQRDLSQLIVGEPVDLQRLGDAHLTRLANAIAGLEAGSTGAADLAVLVRQALLRLPPAPEPEVRVPRRAPWPDESTWERFGCRAQPVGSADFLITARPWVPAWLDTGAERALDAAFREAPRRPDRSVAADPNLLLHTGYKTYSSPGQRAAVRAAFLTPPSSTLLVNLPTGAGKTMVFQLPALNVAAESGLTLVIVPTVALARDQAERFAQMLPVDAATRQQPFAYFGGLPEEAKTQIRSAIAKGTQSILFTSPEAAFGALRRPLFAAAEAGRLRYFVVDEAHIVAQWGEQFRPEFQSLAGLRDALLARCPQGRGFRTLLLTATLTQDTLNTLRPLFGRADFQIVSESMLRPEPAYLINAANSEEEKTARVLEALRFLPRPLLLYTLQRDDAENWFKRIKDEGFRRVRMVRGGDMSEESGQEVLRAWKAREVDVVVATSAFGLGVDQADVRTVVHACLPETVDRYYQEVGRAGRDGNAALALLVSSQADVFKANRIGEERRLSIERAFERWESMWTHRERTESDEGLRVLSLDTLPPRVSQTSELNASWNLRTLVLMARAGLLSFSALSPPSVEPLGTESASAFEARRKRELARFHRQVAVRVEDASRLREDRWNSWLGDLRNALQRADREDLQTIRELRDLKRPINEIFRSLYSLTDPHAGPPPLRGSCPITRRQELDHHSVAEPELLDAERTDLAIQATLARLVAPARDAANRCFIVYETPLDPRGERRFRDELRTLLLRFAKMGIVEFALPDVFAPTAEEWRRLIAYAPSRFLTKTALRETDGPHGRPLPMPRLTLLDEDALRGEELVQAMRAERPLHLIAVPASAHDFTQTTRLLSTMRPHLRWADLITEFAS